MLREDGIDHRPGGLDGLDGLLPGEQRAVTGHGVAEQPLVRGLPVELRVEQQQLALIADELLAGALDARGEGDRGVGGQPEAQVVRSPRTRSSGADGRMALRTSSFSLCTAPNPRYVGGSIASSAATWNRWFSTTSRRHPAVS
jgi:hypothetical protein